MNISGQKPGFTAASTDLSPYAATDIMRPEMAHKHRYDLLSAAVGVASRRAVISSAISSLSLGIR